MNDHLTQISNVLVIGSGGAGLRAAIEVKQSGLSVTVLGKRQKKDVHTSLAAGGINAPFANVDHQDSWQQHFSDTFLEGYSIGDPLSIELLAKESTLLVEEIDKWGANFAKLSNGKIDQRFFGAHTYRRTCYSGDYTGQSILNALLNKAKLLNIPLYDSEYVSDLLIKDNCCFGAMSFNTINGERTIHFADAVIICTGGHTRIWKKSSSRKNENTGDGYHLALKSGCQLIDMEMVQFHPTGMLFPEEISGTLVTEAVRGEGGRLFNGNGERFMNKYDKKRMELSTRDIVTIANYTEIVEGRSSPNGGVYLDISHKEKDLIIKKLPKIYRQFVEEQMIDISKQAMEVAPTAHYSMGGIKVTASEHFTGIEGLYAAGEVAGGVHGANRLGGNSLAEILVFGRRAGIAASNYSRQIKFQPRSEKSIKNAHENLDKVIKKGNELSIPLLNQLREIMWKNCGVVKNQKSLENGLEQISTLKKQVLDIDVRVDSENYNDLVNYFDLESSLVTSEATILCALERKESRGAHQRSDFKNIDINNNLNYEVKMIGADLSISAKKITTLPEELASFVEGTRKIEDFKGKLIE